MGPFKCPDCGIWWAGLEHRCKWYDIKPMPATVTSEPWDTTTTTTVCCTCPSRSLDRTTGWVGTCPVHDVQVTYTT